MTRCLLIESQLPASFWGEAVNTANYLRNRCPSKSLGGRTPYEKWTGSVPDVSHLQPFGADVYTLDRNPAKGKLDPRSRKGVLVGYLGGIQRLPSLAVRGKEDRHYEGREIRFGCYKTAWSYAACR